VTARSTDGAAHQVSLLLDVDPVIAVNDRSQQVVMSRNQTAKLNVLSAGSRDQNLLNAPVTISALTGLLPPGGTQNEVAHLVIAPHSAADFVAKRKARGQRFSFHASGSCQGVPASRSDV